MLPVLYQHMAERHMRQLLHEAEIERMLALVEKPRSKSRLFYPSFLYFIYSRTRLLFRRHVFSRATNMQTISVAESENALRTTFALVHERGLVSDYDDRFIEKFVQTFEQELARRRPST